MGTVTGSPVNPFAVFTPEGMEAERVVQIFSTSMPGLDILHSPGHAFVVGSRGSGKSIAFRYLEPDCQIIVSKRQVEQLDYLALYVSFRETEAQISELSRLEKKHGEFFFNEHLLVLSIAARVTSRVLKNGILIDRAVHNSAIIAHRDFTDSLLGNWPDLSGEESTVTALVDINKHVQRSYRIAIQYVKKHAFLSEISPYEGELYGLDDFLIPYLKLIRALIGFPAERQLMLLLDDADSLTLTQTRIVNSWVARRLSSEVSLKVAAQITAYKTTLTTFDSRIEAPHDYQEINISDVNTKGGSSSYYKRISSMVSQRLRVSGLEVWIDKYFPEDSRQKNAIEKERNRIRMDWDQGLGRGFRARDDIQRYARPEYIRSLGGTRKSRSKYSYSGFEQLVHISSGVPRFFLEAAAEMYDRLLARHPNGGPGADPIPAELQNEVVREQAERQFIWDIRDLRRDVEKLDGTPQKAVRLHNLINGLGSLFEAALIDSASSERKYFSFAFSDEPDLDVIEVLELGLRYGYFFGSVVGRKEGLGRAPLYIMSRRLSPLFNLDPMGFAAYKFMTNANIRQLMDDPDKARKLLRRGRWTEDTDGQPLLPFHTAEVDSNGN